MSDFTLPIPTDDGYSVRPMVEFTEDEWSTVYTGSCIESTYLSYLVRSDEYGLFWIPKIYVRLKQN